MSEDKHTLTTEILTDFTPSTDNISKFQEKFEDLNKNFKTLSEYVSSLAENSNKFDLSIGQKLDEQVKQIRDGVINVDGKTLKKSIEDALVGAIKDRSVNIKGLTDSSDKFELQISEGTRKDLLKKIEAYLGEIAKSINIPTVGNIEVTLNKSALQNLRQKFGKHLSAMVDEKVEFVFTNDDVLVKQLPIGHSDINNVMKRFAAEFQKLLNDPKFIEIDKEALPPVKFSSEQFKKAVEAVQKALGNIDEHLGGIDTKQLESMPNVSEKLTQFKMNVEYLVGRVLNVIEGIESIKPGKDESKDLAKLKTSITNMDKIVENRLVSVIKDMTEILKTSPLSSEDHVQTLSVLENVQSRINKYVVDNIVAADKAIEAAMNIQTQKIDGKKVKSPSIRNLQNHVIKAAQEALQNLDIGDLSIDITKTRELFTNWAKETSNELDLAWLNALKPLQTDLLASNKTILEKFVQSIVHLSKLNLTGNTEQLTPIDVEIDTKIIRTEVEAKLKEITNVLVNNINFSVAGEKALEEGIQLPKKVADTLNKTVRDLLNQQATRLSEQVRERNGVDFSDAQLKSFDKTLFEQSSKLIGNVVDQAHSIAQALSNGVGASGIKNFSAEEQAKIRDHFENTSSDMVKNYSNMMENALGVFMIAGSASEKIHKEIQDKLNKMIENAPVEFEDKELPIKLKGLVGKTQKKLEQTIKANVENWEPESGNFKPSIDYENIISPIQKSINMMLNNLGAEVAHRVNGVFLPKKAINKQQDLIANAVDPTLSVSSKDLHKDVRKYLADGVDMRVKDWEQLVPAFKGDEGLSTVMAANVVVVIQKFHDTIAKHTKSAIQLYRDELDNVQITPNTEPVNFLALKLNQLQDDIAKRIRQSINEQFNFIGQAIRDIQLTPQSIGFDQNMANVPVARRTGGTIAPVGTSETPISMGHDTFVPASILSNYPSLFRGVPGQSTFSEALGSNNNLSNDQERDLYIRDANVTVANTKNRFANKLNPELETELSNYLDNRFLPAIRDIAERSRTAQTPDDRAGIREQKKYIQQELRMAVEMVRKEVTGNNGEKQKGELLIQNESLKNNNALQSETLQTILRMVPALQDYDVEQLRINNATDAWSARLRDAEGNVRSLSGTIDKATGELYQHSEALSLVTRQAGALNYGGGAPLVRSTGNMFDNYYNQPTANNQNKYNPNGDFTSSIVNTMRYITAGAVMGVPSMALYSAWDSAKTFDYNMERARQNFLIKGDLDPSKQLQDVASQRVDAETKGQNLSPAQYNQKVETERQSLVGLASGDTARKSIQDIAIKYAIAPEDVATAYHIGSRSVDDPHEALAIAEAVARGNSIEQIDPTSAATGLESIKNQYGLRGYASNDVMNMMIMAAQMSPAGLQDLMDSQQRAGAVFRDNLPNMTKRDALSTSIGLTGMFSQATARSGAEAGTFFKAFLPRFYTGDGLKAMQQVSTQKGFESLNPYKKDGSKKDFTEILSNFLEKTMTLNDRDRADLWKKVIPGWHMGSAAALDEFLSTLQGTLQNQIGKVKGKANDTNQDGKISQSEAFQYYFNNIKNVKPEQIQMLQQGTLNTFQKREDALKAMWTSAGTDIIYEFKGQFSNAIEYLTIFIRMVKDNAGQIANAISLASKIAAGMGVRFAYSKVMEKMDKSDKEYKEKKYGRVDRYLGAEQQNLNLRRLAVREQMTSHTGRLGDITQDRSQRNAQIARLEMQQRERVGQRTALETERDSFRTNGRGDESPEMVRLQGQVRALNREILNTDIEMNRLKASVRELDTEERIITETNQRLDGEMHQINQSFTSVNNRVEMLTRAYNDLGLDSSNLRTQVQRLDSEFTNGETRMQRYNTMLTDITHSAGLSDNQVTNLRREIEKINRDFQTGAIDAQGYVRQIERLERAHMTGQAGITGGGIGRNPENQSGGGLMDAVIAGSMFAPLMLGRRGITQRVRDFATTRSLSDLFGRGQAMTDPMSRTGAALRDRQGNIIFARDTMRMNNMSAAQREAGGISRLGGLVSEGSALARAGSRLGVIGRGLKAVPGLSLALASFDALNWGMDAASSMGMKGGEKATMRYNNLAKMVNEGKSIDDAKWYNPMKYLGTLAMSSDVAFQGINSWLGGNGVSFKNSSTILGAMLGFNGKNRDDVLANSNYDLGNGVKGKLKDVNAQADALYNKDNFTNPEKDPYGNSLDAITQKQDAEAKALDDLNNAVQTISGDLQRNLGMNQAQYTMDSVRLKLAGVADDSQQMRDLMADFLKKNNAFLDSAIAKLEDKKKSTSDKSSTEYKDLVAQEQDLKAQKAQNNLQLQQNQMGQYDEIVNRLQQQLKNVDNEYGIQQDKAEMAGAAPDSDTVKKINADRVAKSNELIAQAQIDLQQLIKDTNAKGENLTKIQSEILDLQKQQNDNLVSIKESLATTKATFNLPSDVSPLSYMDYAMRNASHRNVTTRMGDVKINVNIDNMSGNHTDIQAMQDALAQAIMRANQQMAQDFNWQVMAGLGR